MMNKYHFIRKERFLDAIPISALKTFYFFTFRFERWIFRFEHYTTLYRSGTYTY